MRILWVKPGKILPLDTGGKLRSYNILRHLSGTHELTYLSYYDGSRDEDYERKILMDLPGTVPICTATTGSTRLTRFFDYLRRITWSAPYAVSRFTALEVQKVLRDWIASRRFDVAVCDFLSSTLNFPETLATPTVLFQHNVETLLWKRRAEFEAKWANRIVAKFEYAKMRRFEHLQLRRFHHVIAVSETDRDIMSRMIDRSRISVVPTGVDLSQYRYDAEVRPLEPLVVFVGSMYWRKCRTHDSELLGATLIRASRSSLATP
jgi:Glycosyltransferase Family 4